MKMKKNKNIKKTDPIRRDREKIGRNEDCPCNSGKKYKLCHEHIYVEIQKKQFLKEKRDENQF